MDDSGQGFLQLSIQRFKQGGRAIPACRSTSLMKLYDAKLLAKTFKSIIPTQIDTLLNARLACSQVQGTKLVKLNQRGISAHYLKAQLPALAKRDAIYTPHQGLPCYKVFSQPILIVNSFALMLRDIWLWMPTRGTCAFTPRPRPHPRTQRLCHLLHSGNCTSVMCI